MDGCGLYLERIVEVGRIKSGFMLVRVLCRNPVLVLV